MVKEVSQPARLEVDGAGSSDIIIRSILDAYKIKHRVIIGQVDRIPTRKHTLY